MPLGSNPAPLIAHQTIFVSRSSGFFFHSALLLNSYWGKVAKHDDLISRLVCPLLSGCAPLMGGSGRNWKEVQSEDPSPATACLIAIPSSSCGGPQHGQDVLPIQPLGVFHMTPWGMGRSFYLHLCHYLLFLKCLHFST